MKLARGIGAFVALAVAGITWSASAAADGRIAITTADGRVASASAPTSSAAYRRALNLGIAAYIYGYPLLDTDRIFRTATSANVPNGQGAGPVNQFSHVRRLADPSDRTVVAPNHDTLYSLAWLDLRRGPIVIHMPVVHRRFAVMELLDPYTNSFGNIGAVGYPPGNYAVIGPGWRGRLPQGVRSLRSRYTRVWIIGRTYVRNAADTPNVVRVQNQYTLTPLAQWGRRYRSAVPKHKSTRARSYSIPGTAAGADPLAFFDALGDQLKKFPPPGADRPLLRRLASVGIGPGLHPRTTARLSAETRRGLRDAVGAGAKQIKADIQTAFLSGARAHNGWLVARTGSYGIDYSRRAIVDAIGVGAPLSSLAIYPFTVTDRNLRPLSATNRYVVHFSPRYLPFPVQAFWSITLYDSSGFLVPNRAGIYLINNRSHLHLNPDGSLDVYVQPDAPRDPVQRRNWLPSPAGAAFRLIMRLYVPRDVGGIISGRTWQPPTVLPCLSGGRTGAGAACAR